MAVYRLYVDEVGNAGFAPRAGANERYLSLVGAIFSLEHMVSHVAPALEALKVEFLPKHQPSNPVILHRKEMLNAKHPFDALRDAGTRIRFDARLLELLISFEFTLIVVTIDKDAHYSRYQNPAHPYHYCMQALLERFVGWLDHNRTVGDVLAEGRGKREDAALCAAFAEAVENGTFQRKEKMQRRLTAHTLSIAGKRANEAGLQVTDLVAHPCFRRALARHTSAPLPGGYAGKIAEAMAPKIRRSPSGKITGYGVKWLP